MTNEQLYDWYFEERRRFDKWPPRALEPFEFPSNGIGISWSVVIHDEPHNAS